MRSFIGRVAEELYAQHGDGISSLYVLFPSRRARLFFNDALARTAQRPLWSPHYLTVDELMGEMAALAPGDPVRLITELYKIYSSYHDEPFDSFYFWGEMLLADFDSVDKYRIDAGVLFRNVADLKALEGDISYLSEDQRKIISRFWGSFGRRGAFSDEQEKFMKIWKSLLPVYHTFREKLTGDGIGYTGMVHRRVAERIERGELPDGGTDPRNYVIAGFNALTPCEKILFDYLKTHHKTRFFWDYDRYYIDDPQQEAGLFLRENLLRYPETAPDPAGNDNFAQSKRITVVSAPSDSLQCRYVHDFLGEVAREQGTPPGKETVVVLTDERLLSPVLYSIPEAVRDINITMGYPLRQTLAYSFVERLIELQARKRRRGARTLFYHSDVSGLLTHPYIAAAAPHEAQVLNGEIVRRQQIYVDSLRLRESGKSLLSLIFSPAEGWHGLQEYLLAALSETARGKADASEPSLPETDAALRYEYFTLIAEQLHKLRNSLDASGVEITESVFASLLRRMLQTITIPYEGEPLQGVQVMGILETRNLDFEHVVILSMNDDTFPGNRAATPSFIPYNLRLAYGLPTPSHHEGVYAYYFYRLLQRARRIDLVYCSHSDDKRTGEPSRYIYQLQYESPHEIAGRRIGLDVNLSSATAISVEKEGEVARQLNEFLTEEGRTISPTTFSRYIECPLKFYFYAVARIRPVEEVTEEIDLPLFGTILHKAMELLYRPLVGTVDPREQIREITASPEIALAVDRALRDLYLHEEPVPGENLSGNLMLIRDIVIKYLNTCLLPYDAAQPAFEIRDLEHPIKVSFPFGEEGTKSVRFSGIADRIDRLPGGMLRVVDYKSGSPHLEFRDIKALFALFSDARRDRNAAVLQTLLYAMMLNRTEGADVQPALYYVRSMNSRDYTPQPWDRTRKMAVESYSDYKQEFEECLALTLTEIFDPGIPFIQCEDKSVCQWCDYREICRR